MEIPKDAKTYELRSSVIWFDNEGIAFSKPRPDAPLRSTDEEIISEVNRFLEITGGKKVCIIVETPPKGETTPKTQRDLVESELNRLIIALAIITTSPLSKMLANIFFSFKPPVYPTKMFSDEKEALEWIRQFNR
ncbi:MAG TPA: hypothetical protein VF868_10870 [Bacteroidia bacterium]|jgi:hypothetical protein